jgi:hypothetical protein
MCDLIFSTTSVRHISDPKRLSEEKQTQYFMKIRPVEPNCFMRTDKRADILSHFTQIKNVYERETINYIVSSSLFSKPKSLKIT